MAFIRSRLALLAICEPLLEVRAGAMELLDQGEPLARGLVELLNHPQALVRRELEVLDLPFEVRDARGIFGLARVAGIRVREAEEDVELRRARGTRPLRRGSDHLRRAVIAGERLDDLAGDIGCDVLVVLLERIAEV